MVSYCVLSFLGSLRIVWYTYTKIDFTTVPDESEVCHGVCGVRKRYLMLKEFTNDCCN